MLRRLWMLVAIAWLVGGSAWIISSGWGYMEYQREEARDRERIAAFEASTGKSFKEWQKQCYAAPQEPTTGYFPPPERYCGPGAMPSREGMDYYVHEVEVLWSPFYSHFRRPLLWNVLVPILISGPLVLWLIPGLARWVRHGSKAPANPQNADVSATVTRRRP